MLILIKKNIFFIFLLLSLFGCSNKEELKTTQKYEEDYIEIGVIGDIPASIEFEKVSFKNINFLDLNQKTTDALDAIMITKEHLEEASDEKYTDFYLNSSIPVIFIQSEKAISAFITHDHTYKNTFENYAQDYFIGYYEGSSFGIALNGDTTKDLEDGYANLFSLLDKFKHTNN